MKYFQYEGWTQDGSLQGDAIWAESKEEVKVKLELQGLRLVKVEEVTAKQKKWTPKDCVELAYRLGLLLSSGISLRRAMDMLVTQGHKRLPYAHLRESISRGYSLSKSLEDLNFPALGCTLIKAGEASGTLEEALGLVKSYYAQELAWHQQIVKATTYPLFLGLMMIGFIGAAFTLIIPQFKLIFTSLGAPLPPLTRILFALSEGPILMGVGLSIVFVLVSAYIFYRRHSYGIDRWLWQHLYHYEWYEAYQYARLLAVTELLISSGISIMEALGMTKDLWNNFYAKELHARVIGGVERGLSLEKSFREAHLGSDFMIELIGIGEETGELETMLGHGSRYYANRLQVWMGRVERLLEPMMIVLMGLMVALLVAGVMLPLFASIGNLSR